MGCSIRPTTDSKSAYHNLSLYTATDANPEDDVGNGSATNNNGILEFELMRISYMIRAIKTSGPDRNSDPIQIPQAGIIQ